jgi:hypothetical protein
LSRAASALLLLLAALPARAEPVWELLPAPAPALKVGRSASVSLTILPRPGHRLDPEAPVLVHVRGEGVTPARALYRRADAADPRAEAPRFELELTAAQPGTARLEARCTFYVCRGERCRPVEAIQRWTLDVRP